MVNCRDCFQSKVKRLDDHWCCELAYREITWSKIAVRGSGDEGRFH